MKSTQSMVDEGNDPSPSTTHKRKAPSAAETAEVCDLIRGKLGQLISAKKNGGKVKETKEYQELATDITLAFSDLKADNRESQLENENKKNDVCNILLTRLYFINLTHIQVSKEKQLLNQFNLQLQNILYEKNHYLKEIKQCRDFRYFLLFIFIIVIFFFIHHLH